METLTQPAKKTIKEKRHTLHEMSNEVKPLVKAGKYPTVNAAVIDIFYKKDGHEVFKTFHQWKAEGKRVKKGETAFFVWAKPLTALKEEQGKTTDEETGNDFFPLCFLFSNMQVMDN